MKETFQYSLFTSVTVLIISVVRCQLAHRDSSTRCLTGFFPCGNLSQCVAQQYQCDGTNHCRNAADEIDCAIDDGWTGQFDREHPVPVAGTPKPVNECALAYYPRGCRCTKLTQLDCSALNLTTVPEDIPHNVTRLFLKYNRIEYIDHSSFIKYPSLDYLNLMGNSLTEIPENSFSSLHTLSKLFLAENKISSIHRGAFCGLDGLQWLFLNGNKLQNLGAGMFAGLERLYWLDIRNNEIQDLQGDVFNDLSSLAWVDFEGNAISSIGPNAFSSNTSLTVLIMKNTSIQTVHKDAFKSQGTLIELDLSYNYISQLPMGIFDHLPKLEILKLQNNPLTTLPLHLLDELESLIELNLGGITNSNISAEMFRSLTELEKVEFVKFDYCRYARHVRTCEPRSDGISSFENLLKNVILRVFVWTIGILTSVGNLGVMVSRAFMKAENKVHTAVVINLCTADFLMGVYLLIIGAHDVQFRDRYNQFALDWTSSVSCKVSGLLGMISSEVSVLTLMFISLERYFIIVYPYSFQQIKARRAVGVLAFIWLMGTALAVVPVLVPFGYFGNFYGSNGMCFPLHLHDPRQQGWEYSAFLFLGINTSAFVVIAVTYTGMLLSIRRTRRAAAQCGIKGDMAYAKRFFFIILTDSLCWLPIVVLKIMALCNYTISKTLYAWIVVFILPINSALNPILYTISTTPFAMWFMRQLKRRKHVSSGCYVESATDTNCVGDVNGNSTYTNLSKRASSCTHGPHRTFTDGSCRLLRQHIPNPNPSIRLNSLPGPSTSSPSSPSSSHTSAAAGSDFNITVPTSLCNVEENAAATTSPPTIVRHKHRRRTVPVVRFSELME